MYRIYIDPKPLLSRPWIKKNREIVHVCPDEILYWKLCKRDVRFHDKHFDFHFFGKI